MDDCAWIGVKEAPSRLVLGLGSKKVHFSILGNFGKLAVNHTFFMVKVLRSQSHALWQNALSKTSAERWLL